MNAHTVENDAHTIRYTDGSVDVLLMVPWGLHSGMIPPPIIAFGDRRFVYAGSAIPPGEGGAS